MKGTSCAFLFKSSSSNFHSCGILKRKHLPFTRYSQGSRQRRADCDCVGGGIINRAIALWGKMATTLFKAISAFGLKTSAFLQSLFLFSFDTLLQAVKNLPSTGPANQPSLPCSTSGSASSASRKNHNGEGDIDSDDNADMTGDSSSSTASAPRDIQASVSKIVPALPRIPPNKKENGATPKVSPAGVDTQLTDGLSHLNLNGTRAAAAPCPASHQAAVNGTGIVTENGNANGVVLNGASPQQIDQDLCNGIAAEDLTRALPVPTTHSVSQLSQPKEEMTTIQLDGETVEILAKVETPEQAAEKAMHSRFMREALDMVSLSVFSFPLEGYGTFPAA